MARLKSRTKMPPGEFQVLHPEAGMQQPFKGSWNEAIEFEVKFRRGNPHLVKKNNWTLERSDAEWFVEQQNVARLKAHNWTEWLVETGEPEPQSYQPTPFQKKRSVAGVINQTKAGIRLYVDWLGDSGTPVAIEIAQRRADICVTCPRNDTTGGLRNWFIEKMAQEIQTVFGIMQDMDLRTAHDERLGICDACLCPLRSKVWAPITHIRKHLTDEAREKLDPRCWIRPENGIAE